MPIKISLDTLMMIFFVLLLIISVWKLYVFMPNKKLSDDDTDENAHHELEQLMLKVLPYSYNENEKIMLRNIYENMLADDSFDKEHYWRFNPNRLNKIIESYLLVHEDCHNIHDIFKQHS